MKNPYWLWRFWMYLAEKGWFRYGGLQSQHPRWWPRATVLFHQGHRSKAMPLGQALDQQLVFGGSVHPAPRRKAYK